MSSPDSATPERQPASALGSYIYIASAAFLFALNTATAGEILLPAPALERDRIVTAVYRTNSQASGKGTLAIRWTDAHGRLVLDRQLPFELRDEDRVSFPLDLRRAAAMRNELRVHFSFEGINRRNQPDRREEDAVAAFVARPPDRDWWDYTIVMWQQYNADAFALLRNLGIGAGQFVGRNRSLPEFLLRNDLRWYAENIATDFYSEYHRWRPDRTTNWSFLRVKELYKKDPASLEPFKRHPSLSDPEWRRRVQERLADAARFWSPYRPLFYSLGDEPGIADLAAYWDFDFSDYALADMRDWLRRRYPTLTALNRQWSTDFESWDLVTPLTTNQAMRREGDNFSAWADHKDFMDHAFAEALQMGNDAVRSVDPDAYVGIGGAQMPGWGGYDYARIARSLTAIEPYDIGNNIEILRSLNPKLAVVTTSFATGPWEKHRIWYELLHGNRGLIIWDDKNGFVTKEGALGPRALEVQPYYTELRNGIAALLIASRRQADPIAIHYSQASMRTEWMLAQRPKGEAWVNRTSSSERRDSEFLRLRESFCRLMEDLGFQYNFVAYDQLERGELIRGGYRVLILPRSSSLSAAEAAAIRDFLDRGGAVLAEGAPGVFDEHSRRLDQPQLDDSRVVRLTGDFLTYHQQRLAGKEAPVLGEMRRPLERAGLRPEIRVEGGFGVETHVFRNGSVRILGLHSNPQLRVDELGPAEFRSNERFARPQTLRVVLPAAMQVYDLRSGRSLGAQKELAIHLDPYEPSLFALSAEPLPELRVSAPARVARGETAVLGVGLGGAPAATHILHVDVFDPAGKAVFAYSGNLRAPAGRAQRLIPFAHNDPAGRWQVRVRDVLSGQVRTAAIELY